MEMEIMKKIHFKNGKISQEYSIHMFFFIQTNIYIVLTLTVKNCSK